MHIQAYTYANTGIYICTYSHIHMHIHAYTCIYSHINMHIQAYTYANTGIYICTYMHIQSYKYAHTGIYICMRRIYVYTYTCSPMPIFERHRSEGIYIYMIWFPYRLQIDHLSICAHYMWSKIAFHSLFVRAAFVHTCMYVCMH